MSTKEPSTPNSELSHNLRGRLEQVTLIATGGMSYVFRAYQPSLSRFIVVKRLKDELLANPETCERFRREARALASVLHQNVAHVYDYVEASSEAFILMEHIDGIDLSTVIQKLGPVPPRVAAAVALGVARGLQQIHAHNLIHRDVKPSNIRLTSRGGVKLMDFGIVLEVSNSSLTHPGMMVGSPSYLSPEQILGDTLTPQSDVFLLGITLYEMLTATRPFKTEGNHTVFQSIREGRFVPARKMNRKVPPVLDTMVSRCLQLNPLARFDGMRALITALEAYLGPGTSNRLEAVILKFLDEEVLIDVAVAPVALEPGPRSRSVFWRLVLVAVVASAIWAAYDWGFRLGQRLGQDEKGAVEALGEPGAVLPRIR